MLFKYDILEMNTAIKPFVMEYFCKKGYNKVFYIDPDICFYNSLIELKTKLNEYDIILTPHMLKPYDDDNHPNDLDILRAGSYNLGFLAIRSTDNAINMLRWWQDKLFHMCMNNLSEGLFVDQKWMDLVPAMFDKVYIERDVSYNVAYWNLHERELIKDEMWHVNNKPLIFFHFSGLPLNNLDLISKHQNRFTLKNFENLRPLFEEYRTMVLNNGNNLFTQICKDYYYNFLPCSNIVIPSFIRKKYSYIFAKVSNVYVPSRKNLKNFIETINETKEVCSVVEEALYCDRKELQYAFPNIIDNDTSLKNYKSWFKDNAIKEYNLNNLIYSDFQDNKLLSNNMIGLTIVGYFENVIGTAEVARNFVKQLYSTGIPYSIFTLISAYHNKLSVEELKEYRQFYTNDMLFEKAVVFINADSIGSFSEEHRNLIRNKYIYGVWWWEFESNFEFDEAFEYVDEVLVFTDFVKLAIEEKAKYYRKRVRKITYPFIKNWEILKIATDVKKELNIENKFVFYFNFDFMSSFDRKNPIDLLKAFAEFSKDKDDVILVLKTLHANSDNENLKVLEKNVIDFGIDDKIIIINDSLSRNELITLVNACDCYISLHRSEGLGLGMLEAMYLGKPVIATKYGGNLEFMNDDNSILVNYKLIEVEKDFGPYKKGWLWAKPDICEAIEKMNLVYSDKFFVKEIGERARKTVTKQFSQNKFSRDIYSMFKC